jgi:hypothetical protein
MSFISCNQMFLYYSASQQKTLMPVWHNLALYMVQAQWHC